MQNLITYIRNLAKTVNHFDWSKLWSTNSAFQTTPPIQWHYMWFYVGFAILYLLLGIWFLFRRGIYPPYRGLLLNFFWTNAILSGILFFMRYERVPLLGMDFLRTLHIASILVWVAFIGYYRLTAYNRDKMAILIEERRNKYLPKTHSVGR